MAGLPGSIEKVDLVRISGRQPGQEGGECGYTGPPRQKAGIPFGVDGKFAKGHFDPDQTA